MFDGRNASDNENGNWIWHLRVPLSDAIRELLFQGYFDPIETSELKTNNNLILYGPPGTGKTYNSVNYAVALCDGKSVEDVQQENYEKVLSRFEELKKQGRIAFTTFHQSYGYEDFIEGIKPVTKEDTGSISYMVEDGIFKRFCSQAEIPAEEEVNYDASIYLMRLKNGESNDLKDSCFQNDEI